MYEGCDSLRRDVKVTSSGQRTYTVTITACQDNDEGSSYLKEESTGYIFHLDDDGELGLYTTCIGITFIGPST